MEREQGGQAPSVIASLIFSTVGRRPGSTNLETRTPKAPRTFFSVGAISTDLPEELQIQDGISNFIKEKVEFERFEHEMAEDPSSI